MEKLSVIIPVFRVEDTLDRCIESVLGQGVADMEVILVDDGSDDSCPQLCDQWAASDQRIRVLHQPNSGLSAARNAGLDAAEGTLITFIDSDDYLAPQTYAALLPLTADADIVEYPLYRHYGSRRQQLVSFSDALYTSARDYWLQGRAYEHAYAWNKLYRRQLFANVRFPQGRVFEDVATLPLLLSQARRIVTTSRGLYYYCANPKGITRTATGPQLAMLLESHLDVLQQWADDAYYMSVLNIQLDVARLTGAPPLLPPRRVSPLAHGLTPMQRLKALALSVMNINNLCNIRRIL